LHHDHVTRGRLTDRKQKGTTMNEKTQPKAAATPGPWTYYEARNTVNHLQFDEPLDVLRNGICQMVPNRNPETIANARLIASAPTMLEALRAIADIGAAGVIEKRETGKPTWYAMDAMRDAARAAIAAAEGGTI